MDMLNQYLYGTSPTLFTSLMCVFGLLLGSFLNVVIVRLPEMMHREEQRFISELTGSALSTQYQSSYNLFTPASHCPQCKAPVRWWMNIPVISFLLLKARCAGCAQPISWQYPAVELLAALVGLATAVHFGVGAKAVMAAVLLWALLTLTVIDLKTQLLPDIITLPLLWLGLLVSSSSSGFTDSTSALWGAVAGYMSLWTIYQLFKLATGKEGMGFGDFKLFAALGAWLGVKLLLPILLFASMTGAVLGIVMMLIQRLSRGQTIAFGPYLATGGVLALFYGETIMVWYFGLMR
jgi:leader peptidase (prepilin peptidase) / N-methyltransferase